MNNIILLIRETYKMDKLLDGKGIAFKDKESYNKYKKLLSKMFELIPIDKDIFGDNCIGMIKNNNDTIDIINVFELPLI